ncbi:MAG: ISL3 family transposase [Streptosporangiaceae bacterium]
MRKSKLWKKLLGVEHVVLEDVDIEVAADGGEVAVAGLRPDRGHRLRCPQCGRKCPFYDAGDGRRRWRALDLGAMRCFLEADAPRVRCLRHGVLTAAVPWARPGSRFTVAFEEQATWLCAQMPWVKAAKLQRVTWRTLQSIVARVVAGLRDGRDRLDGVRRIGIDEKAWRKGHRYITVVTDHDAGRIIWAAEGRNKETLGKFFDDLGPERARLLTHVSADGADWIHEVVREKAPQALICLDAFHVVKWAGEALDGVRRRRAGELRAAGKTDEAASLGKGMWALRKDYRKLTPGQRGSLAVIAADNKQLYRAYLMKEQLREVFKTKGQRGKALLAGLIAWCQRCRIPEFTKLATTLKRFRQLIGNTLDHAVSNGRAEAINTQLAALTARARGFHTAQAFIAMAELTCGGLCPDLPGR